MDELLNAIEAYEAAASRNGELARERTQALDYYLGKPFGNEIDGRSQVVSRDVNETIEWVKPSLMRIFGSGDEIVSFQPTGPEDVQGAQQESDYTNYILTQKNNWFRTSYVWFTDALLQKNAYVKAWWDEKEDTTRENYKGLTDDQFALILQDQEVEVEKHEVYADPSFPGIPQQMLMQMQAAGMPLPQPPQLHDCVLKRTTVYGCVKYKELPPERVLVSSWASSVDLEDVDFVEHFEWQTKSEITQCGFDLPDSVADGDGTGQDFSVSEEQARNIYGEQPFQQEESNDPASKRYKVREVWIRYDKDEDGIAELMHVVVVGHTILLEEDCEFIPLAAITPKMMPHRHVGRSLADEIMDLQLIKSVLLRGTLDNMYLANNGRYGVDEDKVNLDDMLTSRPGGLVRTQGSPATSILPFQHPNTMAQGIQAIEYIDQIKQNRTGVTAYVTSVDANALNETFGGTQMLQNAAMSKIELIARVFAETGVKRLMWIIHALSLKNSRKSEVVRLRNKWVTVDPRNWKKRMDMTVSVGLGTGNREQMMANTGRLLGLQKEALPLGLTDLSKIRYALGKFTQACGFKDDESFWTQPPEGAQPPQPGPAPQVQSAQIKGQVDIQKAAADNANKARELDQKQQDLDRKEKELEIRRQEAMMNMGLKLAEPHSQSVPMV